LAPQQVHRHALDVAEVLPIQTRPGAEENKGVAPAETPGAAETVLIPAGAYRVRVQNSDCRGGYTAVFGRKQGTDVRFVDIELRGTNSETELSDDRPDPI